MKRLLTILAALTIHLLSGCDRLQIRKAADASDRISQVIIRLIFDDDHFDKKE
ncbi:hypothetical protein [Fimbriiglobus ruber]|uniref:hypothetical protein n=1 Tax=Fimbriiglobus ruber TaxID=1908690 RepID=UPI00137A8F1A|nr:hypothetical protein [Fimbriiglobus ruber]